MYKSLIMPIYMIYNYNFVYLKIWIITDKINIILLETNVKNYLNYYLWNSQFKLI